VGRANFPPAIIETSNCDRSRQVKSALARNAGAAVSHERRDLLIEGKGNREN
jgi:hypothetical protein